MLRWLTAGESHGPALVAIMEGLPAGVEVTSADLGAALARRRLGFGRGARMAFERDEVEFLGGVRHGRSLGSPVAIRIGNSEWPKWQTVMSPDPVDPDAYAAADDVNAEKEIARNKPLTRPRPGHADLAGMQKDVYKRQQGGRFPGVRAGERPGAGRRSDQHPGAQRCRRVVGG